MKKNLKVLSIILVLGLLSFQSCDSDAPEFFTIDQEKLLAQELALWASSDSILIVLAQQDYSLSYTYANAIFESLLGLDTLDSTSLVINRDNFDWQLYLVDNEDLDAYATPGANLYVTTGLIGLFESADEFAALLAHLISHADQRHVTKQLLNHCTNEEMVQASNGQNEALIKVAENVFGRRIAFTFSYQDELEVETDVVAYLGETSFSCSAALLFYQELDKQLLQGNPPDFYDSHGAIEDKTSIINNKVTELGCATEVLAESGFTFEDFKNSLP